MGRCLVYVVLGGTVIHTRNRWVRFCVDTYWSMRHPQLVRLDEWARGYASEERSFYTDIEPRVTFRDTLVACSPEWRASNGG